MRKIIIPSSGHYYSSGVHINNPKFVVLDLYGEPEDRRGQEDQVPEEEKKEAINKTAGLRYMAGKEPGKSVGLFLPLPPELAKQYPAEGKAGEDDSDPHLTLLYIGDVSKDRWDELVQIVEDGLREVRPFELTLGPVDTFINHHDQTIFHSTIEGNADLGEIHNNIRQKLLEADFDIKHAGRELKTHVTIEYVDLGEEPKFADIEPIGSWLVDEIEIWGLGNPHIINLNKKAAAINKTATLSDLAIKAIKAIDNIELSYLIVPHIDVTQEYAGQVDSLTRAMLNNPGLQQQIESYVGPIEQEPRRPMQERYEPGPADIFNIPVGEQPVGPGETQEVTYQASKNVFDPKIEKKTKSDYVGPQTSQVGGIGGPVGSDDEDDDKKAQKAWPKPADDDEFDNEWIDPVESRDNLDIDRPHDKEKMLYSND